MFLHEHVRNVKHLSLLYSTGLLFTGFTVFVYTLQVVCNFDYGYEATIPLWHYYTFGDPWAGKKWAAVRNGYGLTNTTISNVYSFFIGLERMRTITLQGQYNLAFAFIYSSSKQPFHNQVG
jgi:hypothetical protein